jgi:hypothetical protein
MRKIAIVPALSGTETHLLGTGLILTTPGAAWAGDWLGRARVRRHSFRDDGLAYLVGGSARDLLRELEATPDPLVLVLYQGPRRGSSFRALEAAASSRKGECRLVVASEILEVRLTVQSPGAGTSSWEQLDAQAIPAQPEG